MKLSSYLKHRGERPAEFARRFDPPLARSEVSRLLSGERQPSVDLMLDIKKATRGKVTLDDWGRKHGSRLRKGPFVEDLPKEC